MPHGVSAQSEAPVNVGQLDHNREEKKLLQTRNVEKDGINPTLEWILSQTTKKE